MRAHYVIIIAGMAAVTYATRVGFIGVARQFQLHPLLKRSLEYVPVAILSALVFPAALAPERRLALTPGNVYLWALIVTGVVLRLSRKPWLAIIAGTASLALMRTLG